MKLLLPISFIALAGIIFFTFIKPIYGEIGQLKTEVASYKEALNTSTDLQKVRDSLVAKYKDITIEDKNRLEHFLPSSINNIELILEVEKIANLYGMPIKDINFEKSKLEGKDPATMDNITVEDNPTANLPYGIFPIEFKIEGRYDSFVAFLNELEHNLRLVDIKSISFEIPIDTTSQLEKTDPNIYIYTLKVDTYWLK